MDTTNEQPTPHVGMDTKVIFRVGGIIGIIVIVFGFGVAVSDMRNGIANLQRDALSDRQSTDKRLERIESILLDLIRTQARMSAKP